ncbi:MAG: hypothetical protein JHC52_11855 [Chthoniobacterales bacterium]|nr:hypothetical protein [Chthoniobacterales bacterium]
MKNAEWFEFAKTLAAEGVAPEEIKERLRARQIDEEEIAAIMNGVARPGPGKNRTPLIAALALLAIVLGTGGFFAYRYLAAAQMVRQMVKHVIFSGNITGQLEGKDKGCELVQFSGALDTTALDAPKAAMKITLDREEKMKRIIGSIPPATDARFLAAASLAIRTGGSFFGGADLRFAEENVYFHLDRTPFSGNSQDPLMALVGALAGPKIAGNPWVRIPAGPAGASETQASWALLFRPTDQVFGSSKELEFLEKKEGEPLGGQATEIHRYKINGSWLTKQMVKTLRELLADKQMMVVGFIQSMATGKDLQDLGNSLDTLQCSDGNMSVWVGKSDTLPRRIVIDLRVSEGGQSPLALLLRGEVNADYGQVVPIEFPAESVTVDDLKKSGILGGLF